MTISTDPTVTTDPAAAADSAPTHQPPGAPVALYFQRCGWCSSPVFPARLECPVCGSGELRREQSRGTGRVHSRRSGNQQFTSVTIELDEGVRVMALIKGVPCACIAVGTRVRFGGMDTGRDSLPVFHLEAGDH